MKSAAERGRIILTWLLALCCLVVLLTNVSYWEKYPLGEELIFFSGTILVGMGAIGRAWCSVFISGRKDGELVRLGPYAMSRNPLYFFSLLGGVGVGLTTETFTVPCCVLILFALYYPMVIRSEEKRLDELFGNAFRAYQREVPCFFPKWSLLENAEPQNYAVCTKTVRHALFDVLLFIWLIGIIEVISSFHEIGLLPHWVTLY